MNKNIIIIGSGLAGLSAAVKIASSNLSCTLVSLQVSERAQSVLAEGGINAAINTKGEDDTIECHYDDTMKGGAYLADPNAVYNLTKHAPDVVNWLWKLGVPFTLNNGQIDLRSFGGQQKKRTAYAKSSTGKMIMTSLIDEARKYEASGKIKRLSHHEFVKLILKDNKCIGCLVYDTYTCEVFPIYGAVIMATGGLTGFFEGYTTGSIKNSGNASAMLFSQGVEFANLEMIQYHPTTIKIPGKRLLVSEAARGEGGRLYIIKNGKPWYFMEELFPKFGNLETRDVVSRQIIKVLAMPECEKQVYLDMTKLSQTTWQNKLSDLRSEIIDYLSIDPANIPIPVSPGIHYFMGGIAVNENHQTNIEGLYAAGECACQYHGANRLGGNSMLGAIYGGIVAAMNAMSSTVEFENTNIEPYTYVKMETNLKLQSSLVNALGIIRDEETILKVINMFENEPKCERINFALAMLYSALNRKESRGAHYRSDYPKLTDEYKKTTIAKYVNGKIQIELRPIPKHMEEIYEKEN